MTNQELQFIARNSIPYHFAADNIQQLMQGFQHRYFSSQSNAHNDHGDRTPAHLALWRKDINNATCQEDFDYTNNSWGFRCNHTALPVDIMAFGCSITYGVGVPQNRTWASVLAQRLGATVANYGIPGLSTRECSHMFTQLTRFIQPKTAVFLLPEYTRAHLSCVVDDRVEYFTAFDNYLQNRIKRRWPHRHTVCENYYNLPMTHHIDQFLMDIHNICTVAEARGINVVMASWAVNSNSILQTQQFDAYGTVCKTIPFIVKDQNGRDRSHPGVVYHQQLAQSIIDNISS